MKRSRAILFLIISCLVGCGGVPSGVNLEKTLKDAVINAANESVTTTEALNSDLILLYFSAHWCPPCRAFTPKLVEYYNQNHGGRLFQVLFVSNDRTEKEMLGYMNETKMPWPGVVFHSEAAKKLNKAYSGDGIPRLTLVNRDGDVLADSFKGKKYLGPQAVLKALDELIKGRHTDSPATAADAKSALPTPEKIAKKYKIDGFGQGGEGHIAIINGQFVAEGDELDKGVRVEQITKSHVEISRDGNTYLLYP